MEIPLYKETKVKKVKLGASEQDFYIVELYRNKDNTLNIVISRHRGSGDTGLFEVVITDTPLETETISKTELWVNAGDVAEQDEAIIHFLTRLLREHNPRLFDTKLPQDVEIEVTRGEEKEYDLVKVYTKEDIIRELQKLYVPLTYEESARRDIEAVKMEIIPAVNGKEPAAYHEAHINIESDALKSLSEPYKAYLIQHIDAHTRVLTFG